MKKLLRDPLVHFLALGAFIFALSALVHEDDRAGDATRIDIAAADISRLQAQWQRQWQRPPTRQELDGLIAAHVREEVLYREALALGLNETDTIVRRRLAQKMEFVMSDATLPSEPDDAELRVYFHAHADRYREPVTLTFSHVYFNRDRRNPDAHQEAEALLADLRRRAMAPTRASEFGDRIMLSPHYEEKSVPEIARDFGGAFADRVAQLDPGQWHGPVESGYGLHLVYVRARTESRLPEFESVRQPVENDYLVERRREANELAYQKLRQRYDIRIDAIPQGEEIQVSQYE